MPSSYQFIFILFFLCRFFPSLLPSFDISSFPSLIFFTITQARMISESRSHHPNAYRSRSSLVSLKTSYTTRLRFQHISKPSISFVHLAVWIKETNTKSQPKNRDLLRVTSSIRHKAVRRPTGRQKAKIWEAEQKEEGSPFQQQKRSHRAYVKKKKQCWYHNRKKNVTFVFAVYDVVCSIFLLFLPLLRFPCCAWYRKETYGQFLSVPDGAVQKKSQTRRK